MDNKPDLKTLLLELRNVCVDEDDCIDAPFRQWSTGTDIHDIWHDIEEQYDCCLGDIWNGRASLED